MEFVHLIGSEKVQQAGTDIAAAAQKIGQAVSYLEEAFRRHHEFMDEWLARLEAILKQKED